MLWTHRGLKMISLHGDVRGYPIMVGPVRGYSLLELRVFPGRFRDTSGTLGGPLVGSNSCWSIPGMVRYWSLRRYV